jgi:hypothetical protein
LIMGCFEFWIEYCWQNRRTWCGKMKHVVRIHVCRTWMQFRGKDIYVNSESRQSMVSNFCIRVSIRNKFSSIWFLTKRRTFWDYSICGNCVICYLGYQKRKGAELVLHIF